MASWGSYVFELCRINANQGLTAEIDWNYTSWSRRCRKILIGLVVRGAKTVVVRGKNRILTRNRKKPEMTVPISHYPPIQPELRRLPRLGWQCSRSLIKAGRCGAFLETFLTPLLI